MRDNFSFDGEWYLPNEPDNRIAGTLHFDPLEGLRLELIGSFVGITGSQDYFKPDIILGFATTGKEITLYKCLEVHRSEPFSGIDTSTIIATYAFLGSFFNSSEELVFNQASSLIRNLDEWLSISGFKVNHNFEEHSTDINYRLPHPIEFDVNEDFRGVFNFVASTPSQSTYTREASIEQKVQFVLKSKRGDLPFKTILNSISQFQMFLTLASYEASYPISITLSSATKKELVGQKECPKHIDLFFSSKIKSGRKEIYHFQMLFNYKDTENSFERILKEWYKQKDILNPILGLLLETFYNPGAFNEQKFLNIVHGLETYHRRYRTNEVRTPEDHEKMIDAILSSTPEEHKQWLQQKLAFSNEPTLQQRLEELLAEYWNPTLAKIIADKDTLMKQTKRSRNYYTHYDKSLENVALHGSDLYYLTERLKVLLICCVLSATSFSKPEIERLLNRNEWQFFSHILQSRPTSGPS